MTTSPPWLSKLAAEVQNVLAETGAHQVDLVGHSQDGMMPNYYIAKLGGARYVHKLVAISPSNHGTNLSQIQTEIDNFPFIVSMVAPLFEGKALSEPSVLDQETGSSFIYGLFGNGDPVASGVHYTVITTDQDHVVTPWTNAFLNDPGVTNITIQNQCPNDLVGHIGEFDDSPVWQNVLNALSESPNPSFQATCTNYGLQGV